MSTPNTPYRCYGISSAQLEMKCQPIVFQDSETMADFDDLDVCLIDIETGHPLVNYDTAKTIRKNSSRQRRCAVKAKPDQRFAIQLCVKPSFDWADSNGLEIKLGFDVGEEVNCRSMYILREERREDCLDLPCFASDKDGNLFFCVDHLTIHNPEHGNDIAHQAQFYFRRLRDDNLVASKSTYRSLESQGKIRIEILRARISARRHESLQVDSTPTYRRQTKEKLLSKGITLEVLLHIETNFERKTHRGNFKSDHSKIRKQQANFDFIYREEGYHDEFVDKDDIVEVGSTKQTPGSEQSKTLSVSSRSVRALSSMSSNLQQETSLTIMPDSLVASPTPAQHVWQGSLIDAATSMDTIDSFRAREISDLMETCNQRCEADKLELQNLDIAIAELARSSEINEHRREVARIEYERLDYECVAVYQAQKNLEEQRQQLEQAGEKWKKRTEDAVACFRSTMKEIEEQSAPWTDARKRKRSED